MGENEKIIELKNVNKIFGDHAAVSDFNLYVNKGEFVTCFGTFLSFNPNAMFPYTSK